MRPETQEDVVPGDGPEAASVPNSHQAELLPGVPPGPWGQEPPSAAARDSVIPTWNQEEKQELWECIQIGLLLKQAYAITC